MEEQISMEEVYSFLQQKGLGMALNPKNSTYRPRFSLVRYDVRFYPTQYLKKVDEKTAVFGETYEAYSLINVASGYRRLEDVAKTFVHEATHADLNELSLLLSRAFSLTMGVLGGIGLYHLTQDNTISPVLTSLTGFFSSGLLTYPIFKGCINLRFSENIVKKITEKRLMRQENEMQ